MSHDFEGPLNCISYCPALPQPSQGPASVYPVPTDPAGINGSAHGARWGPLPAHCVHVQLVRTARCPSDQPNRLNWIVIDGVHLGGDFLPLVRHGRHITALQSTSPISLKRGGQRLSTEI